MPCIYKATKGNDLYIGNNFYEKNDIATIKKCFHDWKNAFD